MTQYLYLIRCQRFHKIGVANDIQTRLAQLSTGNPFELEVVALYGFINAQVVEAAIHQRFSSCRRRGEWFELSEENISDFHAVCGMLGGLTEGWLLASPTVADVEDAEIIQEAALDDSEYTISIQGSDRKYPAVVLRRKERGEGGTIKTISKNGKNSDLYPKYEKEIQEYLSRNKTDGDG